MSIEEAQEEVTAPEVAPEQPAEEEFNPIDLDNPGQAEGPEEDADSIESLAKEALGQIDPDKPEDIEEIEIEWDGVKAKVPAPLRDAFLRHQDYTRKTMDLAEQRKAFEAQSQTFEQTAAQIAQNLNAVVDLAAVNKEIRRLSSLDTSGWPQSQIQQGRARLQELQSQAGQLTQVVNQRVNQVRETESQEMAKLRERAIAEAAAKIPNFTDKRRAELEQFAVDAGADPEVVQTLTDSWAFEMLHWADIGRKFIERQSKAASMKSASAGKPVRTVGGKSAGSKSPEDMSFEEFAAWREAGGR